MLLPLPGESVETSALELGATSKTVGSSMAQLLTAANQGQFSDPLYLELDGVYFRVSIKTLKIL